MRRAAARWRGGSWRWRLPVLRWAPSLARWLPTLTWRRGNVLGFVVSVWVCLITLVQLSLQPNKLLQVGDSGQVRGHAAFVGGVIDIGTQGLGQNWAAVDDGRSIITGVDLPRHAARHRSRASHDTTKRVVHHGEMVKVVENLDGGHFPDFERSRRRIQEIGSRQADNVDVSLAGAFQSDDAFGSNVESEEDSNPPSPSSASLSRWKSATHDEGQASLERYTLTDHQSQIPRPDSPSSQSQPLTHIRHVINPSLHSQAGRNSGRAASPGYESDLPQEQLDQEKFHQRKKVQGTDSRIGSSDHEFANAADRQSSRPGGVPKGVPGSTNRSTMDASRQGQGNSARSSRAGNSPWSASVTSRVEEDQVVVVGTRLKQDGFLEHAYNVTASDLLPLDRDVPDTRPPGCPRQLPDVTSVGPVTVVICTHNEATSVLRRTVYSVLRQTPPHLLHEVIVVDDNSTAGDPERALAAMEVGVNQGKLRLLKTQRRLGLVRGRLLGAREAKGAVLVFLDSHCECGPGWLPPLLQALQLDKRKIVSPYIDVIRSESFAYARSPDNLQGDFSWRLEFGWRSIPLDVLEQRAGPQQPIDTPVISGGLFAVDREFFFDIGAYDEQMDIWGGENMELSFRVWMCGGKMEIIPCSRVGHVFRSSVPYTFPGNRRHTVLRNLARAALVWMDDYSRYFFAAVNMSRDADVGDVSSRVALRERLQCRSFEWYLSHVVTQLHVPSPHALHYGQFKNKGSLLCLTAAPSFSSDDLHLVACQGGDNQTLQLLDTGHLELGDRCVIPAPNKRLALTPCHHHPPTWGVKDGHLGLLSTDLCLTSVDNEFVRLQPCRSRDPFQIWEPSYSFSWTGRSV